MFGHDNQDNQDHQNHNDQHQGDDGAVHPSAPHDDNQQADNGQHNDDAGLGGFVQTPQADGAVPPTDDLLDIKHEALQALTPLVGQLEQTPEERFRTTMMMIQASDNHSLIKVAYEAAKDIANEKERAQALLDIVNEINYFTQHNSQA